MLNNKQKESLIDLTFAADVLRQRLDKLKNPYTPLANKLRSSLNEITNRRDSIIRGSVSSVNKRIYRIQIKYDDQSDNGNDIAEFTVPDTVKFHDLHKAIMAGFEAARKIFNEYDDDPLCATHNALSAAAKIVNGEWEWLCWSETYRVDNSTMACESDSNGLSGDLCW